MTVKGGTSPACAACKYQRRKCSSNCILAPYFPANQPKVFQNVHRLFGVSKIMKLLKELQTNEQKEDALKSIKYESDMRERFPVYGCLTIIYQLRQQLQQAVEELQCAHAQLAIYKEQYNCPMASPPSHLQFGVDVHHDQSSSTEMPFLMNNSNNYLPNANYCGVFVEPHDNVAKPLFGLDTYCDVMRNNNALPIHGQLVHSDALGIGQQGEVSQEYDDIIFNNVADDRQSYVETKEDCESSSESSLRDATQSNEQMSKRELRSVAASFSLISVS